MKIVVPPRAPAAPVSTSKHQFELTANQPAETQVWYSANMPERTPPRPLHPLKTLLARLQNHLCWITLANNFSSDPPMHEEPKERWRIAGQNRPKLDPATGEEYWSEARVRRAEREREIFYGRNLIDSWKFIRVILLYVSKDLSYFFVNWQRKKYKLTTHFLDGRRIHRGKKPLLCLIELCFTNTYCKEDYSTPKAWDQVFS